MAKKSAGILPYRFKEGEMEVMLVHPGGPFFSKKNLGAWSIPKGEYNDDESPLDAAKREFFEETGVRAKGVMIPLQTIRQKSGKIVRAWAMQSNLNVSEIRSNTFEMEWPPKSGTIKEFPEIDKAGWFIMKDAKLKILAAQVPLLEELENIAGNDA